MVRNLEKVNKVKNVERYGLRKGIGIQIRTEGYVGRRHRRKR